MRPKIVPNTKWVEVNKLISGDTFKHGKDLWMYIGPVQFKSPDFTETRNAICLKDGSKGYFEDREAVIDCPIEIREAP